MGNESVGVSPEVLVGASSLVLVLFTVFALLTYLLSAFGLMKMAQREGIENPWLAFIPVGNYYIVGELIDKKLGWVTFVQGSGGKKLLILYVILIVVNLIPIVNIIAGIAAIGLGVLFLENLLQKYTKHSVLLTVLSVVTGGLITPFAIFFVRNNEIRF